MSGCYFSLDEYETDAQVSTSATGNSVSVAAGGEVNQYYGSSLQPVSFAAHAFETDTYTSSGPEREGFLAVILSTFDYHGGTSVASISDGIYSYSLGTCQSSNIGCVYGGNGYSNTPVLVPFELGTSFVVSASSFASFSNSQGFVSTYAGVSFDLLEADGLTPVTAAIVNTPEPVSFTLLTLGLGALLTVAAVRRLLHAKRPSWDLRLTSHGNNHDPLTGKRVPFAARATVMMLKKRIG